MHTTKKNMLKNQLITRTCNNMCELKHATQKMPNGISIYHLVKLQISQIQQQMRSSGSHTLGLPWHRSRSPAPQRSPGMTVQKEFDQTSFQSDICCLQHFFPHTNANCQRQAHLHPHQLEQNIHFSYVIISNATKPQHLPASLQVSSPSRCILIGLVNPSMEVKTSDRGNLHRVKPITMGVWGSWECSAIYAYVIIYMYCINT